MSNDLISRSAVMELIESRFVDGCLEMGDKTLIEGYDLLDDVSDLPTAYDVNKVVEQIKCNSQNIALLYPDDQGGDYEYADGIEVNRAVEIVRAELKV